MTLPWDRFEPDPPDEPELPYVPPRTASESLPPPPPDEAFGPWPTAPSQEEPVPPAEASPDVKDLARDLLAEVMDYAKASASATFKGQDVDITHPTVTAVTAAGKELVVADARNRSWRTLLQGLLADLLIAFVAAIATLSGADPFVKETWIAFGVLLLKSFISAGISYVMRLRVAPTVRSEGEKMQIMPLMVPEKTET